jgi:hypothetical protein
LNDDSQVHVFGDFRIFGLDGHVPMSLEYDIVEMWRCGFHPDPSYLDDELTFTEEYALDGAFIRPLRARRCMRGMHMSS